MSEKSQSSSRIPVVGREVLIPFFLLTVCFAAWGLANNMTDPLVKVFSRIFTMSTVQSALIQFSFYGAYFCLALPAAIIIKKFSYKTGVLLGLGLFAMGALLFYPASKLMVFNFFLIAVFVLAGGLSILETSCNPYIIALGDEKTATQRLNLAQSFNPVGSVIGTMLAGFLILPKINVASDQDRITMAAEELKAIQSAELSAVMGPYVGMAAILVVIWVFIAMTRMPRASDAGTAVEFAPTLSRLLRNPHYSLGVVAQFFYVAAQICVWTYTIHYVSSIVDEGGGQPLIDFLDGSGIAGFVGSIHLIQAGSDMSAETIAGVFHVCALILFLASRFICTALMRVIRPSQLLLALALLAVVLCVVVINSPGLSGVLCLVGVSGCMSLMFPTIYGIALHGLGDDTKLGGAGLVMAILGGALFPLIQGWIIDVKGPAFSYALPLICFVVVAFYAVFDLRAERRAHGSPA